MDEHEEPVVVFNKKVTGSYRVDFDGYDAAARSILKQTVPGAPKPMRRFVGWFNPNTDRWEPLPGETDIYWEVSAEWIGPLAFAFRNAGWRVRGLDFTNITDWLGWCAAPTTIKETDQQRYRRQFRVRTALVRAGAAPWPQATPSQGDALHMRYPLEVDQRDIGVDDDFDHTALVDLLLDAEHDREPAKCPICGRRPAKDKTVHVSCRARLLRALDGKSLTKAVNKMFQAGMCTVCAVRPHQLPRRATCAHCARFVGACQLVERVEITRKDSPS